MPFFIVTVVRNSNLTKISNACLYVPHPSPKDGHRCTSRNPVLLFSLECWTKDNVQNIEMQNNFKYFERYLCPRAYHIPVIFFKDCSQENLKCWVWHPNKISVENFCRYKENSLHQTAHGVYLWERVHRETSEHFLKRNMSVSTLSDTISVECILYKENLNHEATCPHCGTGLYLLGVLTDVLLGTYKREVSGIKCKQKAPFWDVAPCVFCYSSCFRWMYSLHLHCGENQLASILHSHSRENLRSYKIPALSYFVIRKHWCAIRIQIICSAEISLKEKYKATAE
jgi:hypothetical protein